MSSVTTDSTAPPPGLFTKDAATIARTLARPDVSPKGPSSGLRMLLLFMNRAGKGLTPRRRRELERAKRVLSARIARERRRRPPGRRKRSSRPPGPAPKVRPGPSPRT